MLSPGHKRDSLLCSLCEDNYYLIGSACVRCESYYVWFAPLMAVILLLVFIWYLSYTFTHTHSPLTHVGVNLGEPNGAALSLFILCEEREKERERRTYTHAHRETEIVLACECARECVHRKRQNRRRAKSLHSSKYLPRPLLFTLYSSLFTPHQSIGRALK